MTTSKPENLLAGLVSTNPHPKTLSRLKAHSLLDGLIPMPIEKPRRIAKPKWTAEALITLSRETVCKHCAHTTLEMNPLLLVREISPTGAIRETTSPLSCTMHIKELPIEHKTIPYAEIPFCLECIESPELDLHNHFLNQTPSANQTTSAKLETGIAPNQDPVLDTDEIVNNLANLIDNIGE